MSEYSKRCIVTGAAGFIGSALARLLLKETAATVLVIDKLTYAGVPESLKEVGLDSETLSSSNPRLTFLKADICDQEVMDKAFEDFKPDTIFHLAAESHVDRSIDGPGEFIRTNVVGTATLLQAALKWWKTHPSFDTHQHHFSETPVFAGCGVRAVGTNESNTYRRTEREKTIFRSVYEHDLQNWTSGGRALGARCWRCGLAAVEMCDLRLMLLLNSEFLTHNS